MFRFRLDGSSGVPPYLQLVHQVRQSLLLGYLQEGDRLPTVKDAAADLVINPNTVVKAYRQLEHEGLAGGRPGQGTFITATSSPVRGGGAGGPARVAGGLAARRRRGRDERRRGHGADRRGPPRHEEGEGPMTQHDAGGSVPALRTERLGQALRQGVGAAGLHARGAGRRGGRPGRPERRGQDHAAGDDHRAARAHRGPGIGLRRDLAGRDGGRRWPGSATSPRTIRCTATSPSRTCSIWAGR